MVHCEPIIDCEPIIYCEPITHCVPIIYCVRIIYYEPMTHCVPIIYCEPITHCGQTSIVCQLVCATHMLWLLSKLFHQRIYDFFSFCILPQTIYDEAFISLYNLCYTSLPILILGLFEKVQYHSGPSFIPCLVCLLSALCLAFCLAAHSTVWRFVRLLMTLLYVWPSLRLLLAPLTVFAMRLLTAVVLNIVVCAFS